MAVNGWIPGPPAVVRPAWREDLDRYVRTEYRDRTPSGFLAEARRRFRPRRRWPTLRRLIHRLALRPTRPRPAPAESGTEAVGRTRTEWETT